jgi:hypothetical protein
MKRLVLTAAAVLWSACGGGSNSPMSFSVSTKPAVSGASTALTVAGNIDVQRVRLNVGRLKLEGPASANSAAVAPTAGSQSGDDRDGGDDRDAGGDDSGEIEVRQGPFVVDLDAAALTGVVTKVFDADVPPGTYREFRLDIFPGAGLQNASVIVDGTISGQSFTFTSSLLAQQKKEGNFVVGGSSANITLSVDPRSWFGTSSAQLDPRVEANRAAIESNIRQSLDIFQDDDGEGHENHHGDHGGDHD